MTRKLYDLDSHRCDFSATVLRCDPDGEHYAVVLDQTVFFPEGGGQPADTGVLGGAMKAVSLEQGIAYIIACLPIGVVGYYSAIRQARVASAGMLMTGQRPEMSGKGVTMAVMVETYAVFALLVSFLMVNAIKL